ncbi:MAG: hypothetical protein ACJ70O_07080, partial [Nitrososphaera sp.]
KKDPGGRGCPLITMSKSFSDLGIPYSIIINAGVPPLFTRLAYRSRYLFRKDLIETLQTAGSPGAYNLEFSLFL